VQIHTLNTCRCAVSVLTDIVDLVRQICSSDNLQSVTSLASLSYQVRQSSSFRLLLGSVSQARHNQVSKVMEKIGKICKFYRSAASFCDDMTCLKVETLTSQKRAICVLSSSNPADLINRVPPASRSRLHHQAGAARRLLRRSRHYVVHAEMQLLLFYDTQPDIQLAHNYIGISKRSCYLCATFIRFRGVFIVEGAHQQLCCLWTVPPVIAFRDKTRESHFVKALSSLCQNVEAKVKAIPARSCSQYPFHGESVANFSRASLLNNADLTAKLTSDVLMTFKTVQSTLVRCFTSPFISDI
jgi:OTT_1508-like deaminase